MAKKSAATKRKRARASPKAKKRVAPKTPKATPEMEFKDPKDKALWKTFQEAQKKLEKLLSTDLEKLFAQGAPDEIAIRRSVFLIGPPPALKKSGPKQSKRARKTKSKK